VKTRILVLGAGFGGLELTTLLSEALGETVDITLIDKSDAFVFGYAKLDVMFGKKELAEVRLPYGDFAKPGARLLSETVTAIEPSARRVTTDRGVHDADVLVIALGADYDVSKTPGIVLGENEFYSVEGAAHLRGVLPTFRRGHAVIGCCHAPYKCPPAPSECALMLHDYLVERGVRGDCTITLMNAMVSPVPPSPDATAALLAAFAERGIEYLPGRAIASVDSARKVARLDDGRELPCDLFLGIPRNRAPDAVVSAGLTEDGWVKIDPRTLETPFAGVYAIGE
jgi:sulfide:quinone oxidoreductase